MAPTCGLCLAVAMAPLPARSQPADAKGQSWAQIKASRQWTELRDAMTIGEPLNADRLAFLTQTVLPQLESPANRPQIDRVVRRELREAQNWTNDQDSFEQYTKTLANFMVQLARDGKKEPVVRVNAVLLVGELNDDGKKRPWPGAVAPLAAIVADPGLPPEVRIAAAAGLQRHGDAARAAGPQPLTAFADTVAPAIAAMLAAPNGIDRAAADWLATRALILIRALGSAAPPAAVSAVVALFDDAAKPVDLRIRSAAVVGTMQAKEADPGKFVATVESLAGSLLQAEQAAVQSEKSATARPGQEAAQPARRQAGRQLAWRLATLADAVFTDDTTAGMARRIPDATAAAAAKDFARRLRQAALDINQSPGEEAVQAALETLAGVKPPPEPKPEPETPAKPAPPEVDPDNPFK
jgi:hypothetical protein